MADLGRKNMDSDGELSRRFSMDCSLESGDLSIMSPLEVKRRSWVLVDIKRITFGRRLF